MASDSPAPPRKSSRKSVAASRPSLEDEIVRETIEDSRQRIQNMDNAELFKLAEGNMCGKDLDNIYKALQHSDRRLWGAWRVKLATFVESSFLEAVMAAVVCSNMVLVLHETNMDAACIDGRRPQGCTPEDQDQVSYILNVGMLMVYICEGVMKALVFQGAFLRDPWQIFDALIVGISLAGELLGSVMPSMSFMRILRLARLGKMLRLLAHFKELYMIIAGFGSAIISISWASVLLFFVLTVWSAVAVILLHPINHRLVTEEGFHADCGRCERAFSSVWDANLTLLQTIICGDSWGLVAIPIIEDSPGTIFIFSGIIATVSLGICSLILAVIVDSAQEARRRDVVFQESKKRVFEDAQREALVRVCREIDLDGDGTLTIHELCQAYDSYAPFRDIFIKMQMEKEEMEMVCNSMDIDGDGDIKYSEFAETIISIQNMDTSSVLFFLRQTIPHMQCLLKECSTMMHNCQCKLDDLAEHQASDTLVLKELEEAVQLDRCNRLEKAQGDTERCSNGIKALRASDHLRCTATGAQLDQALVALAPKWEAKLREEPAQAVTAVFTNDREHSCFSPERLADMNGALSKTLANTLVGKLGGLCEQMQATLAELQGAPAGNLSDQRRVLYSDSPFLDRLPTEAEDARLLDTSDLRPASLNKAAGKTVKIDVDEPGAIARAAVARPFFGDAKKILTVGSASAGLCEGGDVFS
eukprot:TRINITY_DN28971_c0_g1_i1.p1 TRINITY_DN28971_c0_g1~~TRINITY_DN28971_c0_g1_i1.p1  ORF type:complete len:702 (+),score=150.64 TRINITY_DN28971_c0_g1_i1:83-2188(+)